VQLLKNFPAFYGTRRFITVFTRALHWSLLSQIDPVHTTPSYLRSILILLAFLVGSFLLAFPPMSYMHSSSHPFVLHAIPIPIDGSILLKYLMRL
jgi:hypothetical protein